MNTKGYYYVSKSIIRLVIEPSEIDTILKLLDKTGIKIIERKYTG